MVSLEERAIKDYNSLTENDKNLLLAVEIHMFRNQGGRIIYNKKISKTFRTFLHEKGLEQIIIDIEEKNKKINELK